MKRVSGDGMGESLRDSRGEVVAGGLLGNGQIDRRYEQVPEWQIGVL